MGFSEVEPCSGVVLLLCPAHCFQRWQRGLQCRRGSTLEIEDAIRSEAHMFVADVMESFEFLDRAF